MKTSLLPKLIAACVIAVLFGSGFFVGRQFPRHHFQRFGESPYLFDTSTGRPCSMLRTVTINVDTSSDTKDPKTGGNIFDQAFNGTVTIPKCGD